MIGPVKRAGEPVEALRVKPAEAKP